MLPAADLDPRTAAAIGAGMMAVALADGDVHPRELALIRAFQDEIPDDVDPSGVRMTDPATREVFVRSLLFTALADGRVSPAEAAVIDELARAHGMSREELAALDRTVRSELLAELAGASVDTASPALAHALAGELELDVTFVHDRLTTR